MRELPWLLGLTGGIASGKSTVGRLFAELGVTVIDADQVSRTVVEPGREELKHIANHFGEKMLLADGQLNRQRMRSKVFGDTKARQQLEKILHPAIRSELHSQSLAAKGAYVIWEVPILIEMGLHKVVDHVLVVDCPVSTQLQRLCARDNMTTESAQAMIEAQLPRETRLAAADDILDNSNESANLAAEVGKLHAQYQQLAAASGSGCPHRPGGSE